MKRKRDCLTSDSTTIEKTPPRLEEPWRRASFEKLRVLICEVREPLRWRWYCNKRNNHPKLQLITPRGLVWDFKLSGGCWLRKSRLDLADLRGGAL